MIQKITEDSQALEFRTKSNNIIETLRMMEDHHLISPSVKLGFWSDVWKARSLEDLSEITSRLAAVCEGRPVLHSRPDRQRGEADVVSLVIAALFAFAVLLMVFEVWGLP